MPFNDRVAPISFSFPNMHQLPCEILERIFLDLDWRSLSAFSLTSSYYRDVLSDETFRKQWLLSHNLRRLPPTLRGEYKGNFYRWCKDFAATFDRLKPMISKKRGGWKLILASPKILLYSACITGNVDLAGAIFWAYALFKGNTEISIPYVRLLISKGRFNELENLRNVGVRFSSYVWDMSLVPEKYHYMFKCKKRVVYPITPYSVHVGEYRMDGPGPAVLTVKALRSLWSSGTFKEDIYTSGYYTQKQVSEVVGKEKAAHIFRPRRAFLSENILFAANFLAAGNITEYQRIGIKISKNKER